MEGISHDLAEEWLLREQGSDAHGTVGSLREEALGRAVLDRKLFREHPCRRHGGALECCKRWGFGMVPLRF